MSDPFGPTDPPRPSANPPSRGPSPTDPSDFGASYAYPTSDFPSSELVRRRRLVFTAAIVLVALVAGFLFVRSGNSKSSSEKAADLVQTGLTAYGQGDYSGARVDFQKAIQKDANNAFAHYNLGLIEQVVDKNPAGAEAEYRAAIALKPDFAQPLFNLGIIRADAGAATEAIDLYRRAIAADPSFAQAHFNLGLLLRDADANSAEATSELQIAVGLDASLASRIPETTTTTVRHVTTTPTTAKKR